MGRAVSHLGALGKKFLTVYLGVYTSLITRPFSNFTIRGTGSREGGGGGRYSWLCCCPCTLHVGRVFCFGCIYAPLGHPYALSGDAHPSWRFLVVLVFKDGRVNVWETLILHLVLFRYRFGGCVRVLVCVCVCRYFVSCNFGEMPERFLHFQFIRFGCCLP